MENSGGPGSSKPPPPSRLLSWATARATPHLAGWPHTPPHPNPLPLTRVTSTLFPHTSHAAGKRLDLLQYRYRYAVPHPYLDAHSQLRALLVQRTLGRAGLGPGAVLLVCAQQSAWEVEHSSAVCNCTVYVTLCLCDTAGRQQAHRRAGSCPFTRSASYAKPRSRLQGLVQLRALDCTARVVKPVPA